MPPSSWTSSMSASPSTRNCQGQQQIMAIYRCPHPKAEPEGGAKKRMVAVRNLAQTNTYLFKFNAKNLAKSERRISAMANICATFPEFNHLRLIKERFDRIYTAPDRRTAEVYCKEWAELIPPSGCRQIEAWKKRFKVEPELFDDLRSARTPSRGSGTRKSSITLNPTAASPTP